MKQLSPAVIRLAVSLTLATFAQQSAQALSYSADAPDAMLCFRLPGASKDLEVDIGHVTNYVNMPVGASTNLTAFFYTTSQLTNSIGTPFDGVKFSVFATEWDTTFPTYPYPLHTALFTLARSTPSTPSIPFARGISSSMSLLAGDIQTLGHNASSYSSGNPPGAGNTSTAIEISPGNTESCERQLGTSGDFTGAAPNSVENIAPSPFSGAIVSDFYIDVPVGSPDKFNNNATSGNASYLGYFTMNPDGSVIFTRANLSPPAPTITAARSGNITTITFPTTAGTKYTLRYTNDAGLTSPISTWPTNSTVITGDGNPKFFTDSNAFFDRFYSVKAQ